MGEFEDAARAAGMVTNPGGTERLHQYWVHGKGAAKIRWGEGGDFARCTRQLMEEAHFTPEQAHGYCNLAHKAALGFYPATHAAMEHKAGRAASVADKKPYGDVTYADPKNGKYPLDTEAHIRAAWSYINMPKNAAQYSAAELAAVKAKIKAAMKRIGADVSDGDKSNGSASRSELMRDYPLEDLHIVRSADGGDGRTMEAFAAVFNTETFIEDGQGQYLEVIEPFAFNKRIADLKRSRAGLGQVKVMFNHARDLEGNPEPRFMMPVATPVSIEATPRGLLTRSRFNGTPLAEEVLELVKSGSVTSMSFTGQIVRSDPQLNRGQRYRPGPSGLPVVRRQELGLREFGPVLFAAYEDAGINGVRMSTPGTWEPDGKEDEALLPDGEAASGEPPTPEGEHSARYHQHALYLLRAKEQREKAGLVW